MNSKKDVLPIVIASAVALLVTGIVRWLIPGGTVIKQQPIKKELSLPDIPLMVKSEKKKVIDAQVLVTTGTIAKDEKITLQKLTWKTWPMNSLQPFFIAKDDKGTPLNNRADYDNALNMWAKSEIAAGTPLNISMLTNSDPAVIAAQRAREKAAAEKKKQEEKRKNENTIKVGYRAVTFSVDQKSSVSTSMISPGDLVDIIMNGDGNGRSHVYKAIKILAIDGVTKIENKNTNNSTGLFEGAMSMTGMLSPRNVTLEIKEKLVNTMLKQAGNNGVIISLRSQKEAVEEEDQEGVDVSEEADAGDPTVLLGALNINRKTSAEILKDAQKRKAEEERDVAMLISNMNSLSKKISRQSGLGDGDGKSSGEASNYEVVSGKITGNKMDKKDEDTVEPVKIHRNLTTTAVQFSKDGKKLESSSSGSSGPLGSGGIGGIGSSAQAMGNVAKALSSI